MSETLLIALLSLTGTLAGSLGGILAANRLVVYRLTALERKVEKHNSLIERTYALERRVSLAEQRVGTLEHKGGNAQ